MMQPPDKPKPWEEGPNPDIGRLAGLLARSHEDGGLPKGELAVLRRMDPAGVLPPACWRLLLTMRAPKPAEERAWALLIATMVDACGAAVATIGTALAGGEERGPAYAEGRFVRLLRARGLNEVAHEARQAARWCGAQGRSIRFTDHRRSDGFGPFILAAALCLDGDAERRAHTLARDYFSTLTRRDTAPET